jgi:hypothetical protein
VEEGVLHLKRVAVAEVNKAQGMQKVPFASTRRLEILDFLGSDYDERTGGMADEREIEIWRPDRGERVRKANGSVDSLAAQPKHPMIPRTIFRGKSVVFRVLGSQPVGAEQAVPAEQ